MIENKFIFLDTDFTTRDEIFHFIAEKLAEAGDAESADAVVQGLYDREKMISTYMDDGICIPHCKSDTIKNARVAIVRNITLVPWETDTEIEQADLMFFLAVPEQAKQAHLRILAEIAQLLLDKDFVRQVRDACTAQQVIDLLEPINQPDK